MTYTLVVYQLRFTLCAIKMADMQIVLAGKKVEPQFVEMKVPLYSYGCEKKIKKALSRLRGTICISCLCCNWKWNFIESWTKFKNRKGKKTLLIVIYRESMLIWHVGIHSVHVDYQAQKVTVWGICNRDDVLAAIRRKRREAYFWDEPESKIAPLSMRYDEIEPARSSRLMTALTICKFRKSWRKLFPLILY